MSLYTSGICGLAFQGGEGSHKHLPPELLCSVNGSLSLLSTKGSDGVSSHLLHTNSMHQCSSSMPCMLLTYSFACYLHTALHVTYIQLCMLLTYSFACYLHTALHVTYIQLCMLLTYSFACYLHTALHVTYIQLCILLTYSFACYLHTALHDIYLHTALHATYSLGPENNVQLQSTYVQPLFKTLCGTIYVHTVNQKHCHKCTHPPTISL